VTAKRKRRRSRGTRASGSASSGADQSPTTAADAEEDPAAGTEADAPSRRGPPRSAETNEDRPRRRGLFGGAPSPYPPLGPSLAAGLRATVSWPAIVGVAFAGELVLWGVFVLLGFPPPPGAMAGLMAIPPVHLLVDVPLARTVGESTLALVGVMLGIVVIRSVVVGILATAVVDVLREGRPDLRRSLRRLPRVAAGLVQLMVLEVAGFVLALFLLGAFLPAFGQMGVLLAMVFGLHFLGMAPAILAAEQVRPPDALRLSFRAGRLPGFRHLGLVIAYFLLTVSVLLQVGAGFLPPVTPSILVWSFGLVATLLHVGVLGTLAYRWLAVREEPAIALAKVGSAAPKGTQRSGSKGSGKRRSRP
jgi:hypothetical protein